MPLSLSIVSPTFKFIWLKYKLNKKIKKRELYIKALVQTIEGKSIQRAILETSDLQRIYLEIKCIDWDYLQDFEDERLIKVNTRSSIGSGLLYSFELTNLGKKYFDT